MPFLKELFGSIPNTASAGRGSRFTSNARNTHVKTYLPQKRLQQQLKFVTTFPERSDSDGRAPHPPQPHSRLLVAKLIRRELVVCFFLRPKRYSKLLGGGWANLSDKTTRKEAWNHKKIHMTWFWTSYYYFAQCRTWGGKTLARMCSGLLASKPTISAQTTFKPWDSIFHKPANPFSTQQFLRGPYQK